MAAVLMVLILKTGVGDRDKVFAARESIVLIMPELVVSYF